MRRYRGGYQPNQQNESNPELNQAFMEEENQESHTQSQTHNQEIQHLQEQFQQIQVNPNQDLDPLHQIGTIQPIQEEENFPRFVNNSQFGGKKRKTYRKKNQKTRKHRKHRKSIKCRY